MRPSKIRDSLSKATPSTSFVFTGKRISEQNVLYLSCGMMFSTIRMKSQRACDTPALPMNTGSACAFLIPLYAHEARAGADGTTSACSLMRF